MRFRHNDPMGGGGGGFGAGPTYEKSGRVDALGAVAGKSRKMSAQAGNGFCNLSEMSTPSMHAGIVLTQIGGVSSGKEHDSNSLFSAGSGRFDQPRKLSREHTHTMSDICYGAQV